MKKKHQKLHKDDKILEQIKIIFAQNYKKYGSPRITIELHNKGVKINEKRVARIMKKYHISAAPKLKRYCSYRGEVGVTAPNLIHRQFDKGSPFMILGTDVTQFRIGDEKLYLSPIIDFHTREIVAYDISRHPNMLQIQRMMRRLTDRYKADVCGAVIHSDQGWQYQQKWFQDFLKENGIKQSMSRKGNCLDNSPTENFFGRLKEEMFYGQEWRYESLQDLRVAIERWINYYNTERIITILKNSPLKYKSTLVRECA